MPLARMLLCVASCLALLQASRALPQHEDAKSRILVDEASNQGLMAEMVQKPIFYFGEMKSSDLQLGDPCSFSFTCDSGCCLKDKSGKTRCRRKALKDERCSVGQMKLDMYLHHCPCELGNQYCSDEPEARCMA